MKRRVAFIALSLAIVAFCCIIQPPSGLTAEGLRGIGLLVAIILLFASEAIPPSITALLALVSMPALGVMDLSGIWGAAFGQMACYFMLASFGVGTALGNTHIPHAIVKLVLRWSQGNAWRLVIGFMGGSALISSFMSDIPTCAIFCTLALSLLKESGEDKPGQSRLGKALLIAVPVGSILGGFATPAGNGVNIMVMQAVHDVTGEELSFGLWSAAGVPTCIVMVAVCSLLLYHFAKPSNISKVAVDDICMALREKAIITAIDIKFIIILATMMALWISSSWIPSINIAVVAIVGVIVMHLPGIDLFKKGDFIKGVSWDAFIVCGGIVALGTGVQSTGAITWIVDNALVGLQGTPIIVVLLLFSLIPCIVHMATPAAGAIYALTCIPLLTAGLTLGIDPRLVGLIVGAWVCIVFVQPLDLVYLLSYGHGYYSAHELMRYGIIPTIILLALTVTWLPFVCSML